MIGRKHSKSLISRLEALESRKPGTLIFEVMQDDGSHKRMGFSEFMARRKEPDFENGVYDTGLPEWRIVEGSNLKELDELLYGMFGKDVTVK